MMRKSMVLAFLLLSSAWLSLIANPSGAANTSRASTLVRVGDWPLNRNVIIADLLKAADRNWRAVSTPGRRYSVRSLFSSMLAYAQADQHLERIPVFIERAEALQERNPDNRHYGNFYWYSDETEVLDANAVDFCMQHGALLWLLYRDRIDSASRSRLHKMLTIATQGLLNHLPRPTYTNIALMNASDLILLGEALGNEAAVKAGVRRLTVFTLIIWEQGVREYVSPTYYGTNMEAALLLQAFAQNSDVRDTAAVICELLESDMALNRIDSRVVLSGTCSRTYDFLYKRGGVDQILTTFNWLNKPAPSSSIKFHHQFFSPLYAKHFPAKNTAELQNILPRSVTQRWGITPYKTRTHYICHDISLCTSAAIYGRMDIPLSIDMPYSGVDPEVQLYFLADGRDDPYGNSKIAAGNHRKALHLTPWWCAVQDKNQALAFVLYDQATLKDIHEELQSHIVFRKQLDAIWIDNQQIEINSLKANPLTLKRGQSLFLRQGGATAAIAIPWLQSQGGDPTQILLMDDGNDLNALRLTVRHTIQSREPSKPVQCAGTLYRVEIGSNLNTAEQFAAFRNEFMTNPAQIEQTDDKFSVIWSRSTQQLSLKNICLTNPTTVAAAPLPAVEVLAVNGDEIGRTILEKSSYVRDYLKNKQPPRPIQVSAKPPTIVSALDGCFTVPFEIGEDQDRRYLWVREEQGVKGWTSGEITWELITEQAGSYKIEAEILAPTPEDDSFYVSAYTENNEFRIPEFAWSTGIDQKWRWAKVVAADEQPRRTLFHLPAGKVNLKFRTREAGIKIAGLRLERVEEVEK